MKSSLISVFFLLLLLGCNLVDFKLTEAGSNVDVTFKFQTASLTRSYTSIIGDENKINQFCCYIFDTDTGELLNNFTCSGEITSHTVSLPERRISVYAFANVDEECFRGIIRMNNFVNAKVGWDYLLDNGFFPMSSHTSIDLNDDTTVTMQLDQMMSRFYLTRITNLFDKPIRLKCVFLSNVQGASYAGRDVNTDIWYSLYGREGTSIDDVISPENPPLIGKYGIISDGPTLDTSDYILPRKAFYSYPNYSLIDSNGWEYWAAENERFTRLVMVAEIDGVDYYYPVNLAGILPGYSYDVMITVTRLGSDDPDTFDFVEHEDIVIDFGGMDGFDVEIIF